MADSVSGLVRRAQAGDQQAFGDLVERYSALVHGIVLDLVRRQDEVEDLVQESFCKAYESLHLLSDPARFPTWLRRIAANVSSSWLRQTRVRKRQDIVTEIAWRQRSPQQPDEVHEGSESAHLLWSALDRLRPELRRAVVLCCLEGGSVAEVAEFLDVPRTRVRWWVYKGRQKLRAELEGTLARGVADTGRARRIRDRVAAALPAAPVLWTLPRRSGWTLARGIAASVGLALVGGLGLGLQQRWQEVRAASVGPPAVLRVRTAAWEAPAFSLNSSPSAPRHGDRVRVSVTSASSQGVAPTLHYVADLLTHAQDRVTPLRLDGDQWVAEIVVPEGASIVFMGVSEDDQAWNRRRDVDEATWKESFREYRWSLVVHGVDGKPVEGAGLALGLMARYQDEPREKVLGHLSREIARHPGNFAAHRARWKTLSRGGTAQDTARVAEERKRLRQRYPDSPRAWEAGAETALDPARQLVDVAERFPDWEQADRVLLGAAGMVGDSSVRMAALRTLLRRYPTSPFQDEAHLLLLEHLAVASPAAFAQLADSLIYGTKVVSWTRTGESFQSHGVTRTRGIVPQGLAYSIRVEQALAAGDSSLVRRLARRMLDSDLIDPKAFWHCGRLLARQETRDPEMRALARPLLERARVQADLSVLLGMPGYAPSESRAGSRKEIEHRVARLAAWIDDSLVRRRDLPPQTLPIQTADGS